MKTKLRNLLLILAISLTGVSAAKAQAIIRIAGATADRGNVHAAILYALGSTDGSTLTSGSFGYIGTKGLSGANSGIFVGTLQSTGSAVIIETTFNGAEAGIQTVAASIAIGYLPTSSTVSSGAGHAGLADPTVSGNPNTQAVPDIAVADQEQSASAFYGKYHGFVYPALTEDANSPVGISPFKWLVSKGAPSWGTNLTSNAARQLFETEACLWRFSRQSF